MKVQEVVGEGDRRDRANRLFSRGRVRGIIKLFLRRCGKGSRGMGCVVGVRRGKWLLWMGF